MENVSLFMEGNQAFAESWRVKNSTWNFMGKKRSGLIGFKLFLPFIALSLFLLFLYFQGFKGSVNASLTVFTGEPVKTFLDDSLSLIEKETDPWLLLAVNKAVKWFNFFMGGSIG